MSVSTQFIKDTTELKGQEFVQRKNGFKIVTDEFEVSVQFSDWTSRTKKLRIFADGEESVDFTEARDMATERESHMKGVDEETDKLYASLNRKVVKNKKQLVLDAIESVDVLRVILDGHKFGWWTSAGCGMCPCSPGFIADVKAPRISSVKTVGATYWNSNDEISEIFITKK